MTDLDMAARTWKFTVWRHGGITMREVEEAMRGGTVDPSMRPVEAHAAILAARGDPAPPVLGAVHLLHPRTVAALLWEATRGWGSLFRCIFAHGLDPEVHELEAGVTQCRCGRRYNLGVRRRR